MNTNTNAHKIDGSAFLLVKERLDEYRKTRTEDARNEVWKQVDRSLPQIDRSKPGNWAIDLTFEKSDRAYLVKRGMSVLTESDDDHVYL